MREHLSRKAIEVRDEAKRRCPADTGRLRSSITYELGRSDRPHAVVGSEVSYPRFPDEVSDDDPFAWSPEDEEALGPFPTADDIDWDGEP